MKSLLCFLLLFSPWLSHTLTLEGVWKSDAEQTTTYNKSTAKLTRKQTKFLSQILGKLTVEYVNGIMRLEMPDTKVSVNGRFKGFKGFKK